MTKFHSSFLKYRYFWRCTVVNTSNYSLTFIFFILDSEVCRALSQSASVTLWRPSSKNVLCQLRLTLSPAKICSVFSVPLMLVLLIFWGIMNRRSRKGGKAQSCMPPSKASNYVSSTCSPRVSPSLWDNLVFPSWCLTKSPTLFTG